MRKRRVVVKGIPYGFSRPVELYTTATSLTSGLIAIARRLGFDKTLPLEVIFKNCAYGEQKPDGSWRIIYPD